MSVKKNFSFELTPEQTKHYARFFFFCFCYCTVFQKLSVFRIIVCGAVVIAATQKIQEKIKKGKPNYLKLGSYDCVGSLKWFLKWQHDGVSMTVYRHWLQFTHPKFHPIPCAWCFLLAGHLLQPRDSQQEILWTRAWMDLRCLNHECTSVEILGPDHLPFSLRS